MRRNPEKRAGLRWVAVGLSVVLATAAGCYWPDSDQDGVIDKQDNCPADANNLQQDSDFDGIGDACDPPVSFVEVGDQQNGTALLMAPNTVQGTVSPTDLVDSWTIAGLPAGQLQLSCTVTGGFVGLQIDVNGSQTNDFYCGSGATMIAGVPEDGTVVVRLLGSANPGGTYTLEASFAQ